MRQREDKSRIEFRHLRYFLAVAEDLNISRAAARIGIAQPPLSAQIRKLEDYLQCQIFVRTARGVELTPAGENFVSHARKLLDGIEIAVSSSRQVSRGERGEFRLGTIYSALFLIVPEIVRQFEAAFPKATITVEEMSVNDQVSALQLGQLDAGIVRVPLNDVALASVPLLHEELVAALPVGHALCAMSSITLEDLISETKVAPNSDGIVSFKKQSREIFKRNNLPREGYQAPELNTLLGLVEAGLGPALVPSSVSKLKYANIVFRELDGIPPAFVIGAAWNEAFSSPMKEAFIRDVLPRVANIISEPARGVIDDEQ